MAGLLAAVGSAAAQEAPIRLGTGPVAGHYFPVGGALCRLVEESPAERRCFVEATSGSAENLARLKAGEFDVVLLQSDWQYLTFQGGGGPGFEEPFSDLRALFSLHAQPFTLIVSADGGIERWEDLRDRRLSMGPAESGSWKAGQSLFRELGEDASSFAQIIDLPVVEAVVALCQGQLDAFLLPISHPNGLAAAVTEACDARILPIDGEAVEAVLERSPIFTLAWVPGGLYRGNPGAVPSVGVRASAVARADTDPALVHDLVAAVFDGLDELRRQHPTLAMLDPGTMRSAGLSAPLHEGAARYFRARGWLDGGVPPEAGTAPFGGATQGENLGGEAPENPPSE